MEATRAAGLGVVAVPQAGSPPRSAYASHQEHVKGSVTPGRLADLVVLSDDPVAVSPGNGAGIEVQATFAGGRCGYDGGALRLPLAG